MLSSHKVRKKSVSIIIVTFNSEKYISNCVRAVHENFSEQYTYSMVIVDNDSQDKTKVIIEKLRLNDPTIKTVFNRNNSGFSKAVNIGLRINEKSDYFLLLNPDTIINKTSVDNLIQCAQKMSAGIVGGNTYDENEIQNGSYFRFPNLLVGLYDFTNLRKLMPSDYWHNYFYYLDCDFTRLSCFPVDVVTGGFMLIDKDTINRIGYLDERFFMYLEDIDFCLRAKRAGISIIHSNESATVHYGGGSSGNRDRVRHSAWLLSRKKYFLKNFNLLSNIIIQPIFLFDDALILLKKYIT